MSEEMNRDNVFSDENVENIERKVNETAADAPLESETDISSVSDIAETVSEAQGSFETESADIKEEAKVIPRMDEEGWIWFDRQETPAAEAEPETAAKNEEIPAAETVAAENKANASVRSEKPKTGRGVKAYMVAMTAALLAVAVMLGFCIMKLNDGSAKNDAAPTVTMNDKSDTDKIKSTENETSLTVQRSESNTDGELTALYNEVSKSCVSILCKVTVSGGFFGQSYSGQSLGSGFVIDKSGYIVTNQHVIEDAETITVQFYDGEQIEATLVGADETCDLAVLKIDTSKTERTLYPVTFGNSDNVEVGQKVFAIGTPSNIKLAGTLTYGVISGVKREVSLTNDSGSVVKTMTLIQTDATLNPGNSGGPLFNMKGEVIGINTLKLSSTYEGIGFSIPSAGAVEVINDLIKNGKVSDNSGSYVKGSAKLGIEGATVNDTVKQNYNLPDNVPKGVYVFTVSRKATVYKEGLSAEDIITEFNGTAVTSIDQLKELLAECKAGDTATMKYYRLDRRDETKGEYFEITFKLDAQS